MVRELLRSKVKEDVYVSVNNITHSKVSQDIRILYYIRGDIKLYPISANIMRAIKSGMYEY